MTAAQEMAKDHEGRHLERRGIADLWQREWKGSMIVEVRAAHARLSTLEATFHAKLGGIGPEPEPLKEG